MTLAGFLEPLKADEPPDADDTGEIVVQATRSGRRLAEEAIRVDVVDKEELDEKLSERPGDISMLLSEIGGLRTQVTAPSLGAANIRIQGMRGRYTQVLTDGLPLTGGHESSLGLLQVTPSDLAQVEIIKGAASALYGPSALGGVVNLVSRRPGEHMAGELIANATSRNGQDLTGYVAAPLNERWGYSVVGSANRQSQKDLDGDGWTDIPSYGRWTLRPRVFWAGEDEANGFFTLGAMDERRKGGTLPGRTVPDGTPFPENLHSQRLDGGFFASFDVQDMGTLQVRGAGTREKNAHRFGSVLEDDHHGTVFSEATIGSGEHRGATTWLAGFAFQSDDFHSNAFPAFAYKYTDPALFAQIEHDVLSDLTVSVSARADFHNQFGSRFSPRLSALYHPGAWSFRASYGEGFYAPTPFVEEIEAAGLARLEPLRGLKAETARTASLDGGYTEGPLDAHVTLFASSIRNAVQLLETGAQSVRLVNSADTSRTRGEEVLLRYKLDELTISGSYAHVVATEADVSSGGRRTVPLTPRDTANFNAVWEKAHSGQIGIEVLYTGRQSLEDNPYRAQSRPYVELGMMGEIVLGKARLFLNLENLLNVRQTKHDPLLLRHRGPDGRWTVDAWAPLDGFVANAGVRFQFAAE